MKRILKGLLMAAALTVVAAPAMAQSNALQNYYGFLAQHPELQTALTGNPSLYRSPGFMSQHPTLWSYLQQNPSAYQAMLAKAPAYRPDGNAYALANFLNSHPQVNQALAANPALSTDPTFLARHPNFRRFLQKHPAVQRQMAQRGWNFTQWQRYHRWQDRNQWRDADDWSDRDWRDRQRALDEAEEREEHEEFEEHEHHDHGKHLGWYKHHGKKHHDDDDDDAPGADYASQHGHHGGHEHHGHHGHDMD